MFPEMPDEAAVVLPMVLGGIGVYVAFYLLHRKLPSDFLCVGKVKELYLHPVKSCRGISVQEADCTWLGLQSSGVYDRHYMIMDPRNGNSILTLCQNHRLALISTLITDKNIQIMAPDMDPLVLPKAAAKGNKIYTCRQFGEDHEAFDCGDEAANWVCTFLGVNSLRLVSGMNAVEHRSASFYTSKVNGKFKPQFLLPEVSTCNILSQASIDDLNSHLPEKVNARRFRPNIVVEGCGPFEEDNWDELQIGSTRLFQFALCDRCALTTVNPDNPEQGHVKKEPLNTLRNIRMIPGYKTPCMGVRLGMSRAGHIAVGDVVYARKKTT